MQFLTLFTSFVGFAGPTVWKNLIKLSEGHPKLIKWENAPKIAKNVRRK